MGTIRDKNVYELYELYEPRAKMGTIRDKNVYEPTAKLPSAKTCTSPEQKCVGAEGKIIRIVRLLRIVRFW